MRRAGILGGLGPASTLDYYRGIIDGVRSEAEGSDYPHLIINSVNMTEMLGYVAREDWDELVSMLVGAIEQLEAAGAQFAAIACNTPHIVFERIQERSALPLISIVDTACSYAQQENYESVVVLGTRFTMSSGLYTRALNGYGIAAHIPSQDEQLFFQDRIEHYLQSGIVTPGYQQQMLGIARELIERHQADSLLLGCTELPQMIQEGTIDTNLINTTQLHIEAIVKKILEVALR
ncbi:MAG: amino acid racemase [Coriobacteriia bacterium]|nr:amino acid racemase [Coriobacteriia bacterium]